MPTISLSLDGYSMRLCPTWERWGVLALALCVLGLGATVAETREPEFTSIAEVRLLPRSQAAKGHPARMRGVVTYFNRERGTLYFQDGDQGILVHFARADADCRPGSRVEIEGVTQEHPSRIGVCLGEARVRTLGTDSLPQPFDLSISESTSIDALGRYCRVRGVVQEAERVQAGQWWFVIRDGSEAIHCLVRAGVPEEFDPLTLLDSEVAVYGIAQPTNDDPMSNRVVLVCHDFRNLTVEKSLPREPFAAPICPISNFSESESHAVRVRATVVGEPEKNRFTARDSSGTCSVLALGRCWVHVGDTIDLIGFPRIGADGPRFLATRVALLPRGGTGEPRPTLYDIADLRMMDHKEAEKRIPVRVRGVVTQRHPLHCDGFIQDGPHGIFVSGAAEPLPPDKVVEIDGFTAPGAVLPMVRVERVRVIGDPEPDPRRVPRRIVLEDIQSCRLDCDLVQVQGVVQEVKVWEGNLVLVLLTNLGYVEVCVAEGTVEEATTLIDAEVRIVGVYGVVPDRYRQSNGYRVFATRLNLVETMKSPVSDPFETTVVPIKRLLTDQRDRLGSHRVKIQGIVTGVGRGGSIFVQEDKASVRVLLAESVLVRPGDRVEAAGFFDHGRAAPRLAGAILRVVDNVLPPRPEMITPGDAASGKFDGQSVRLNGRFLNRYHRDNEEVILLQTPDTVFEVFLEGGTTSTTREFAAGALLEVAGVCVVQADRITGVRSFRVEGVNADRIEVVETPSKWLSPIARWLIGGGTTVLIVTFAWVAILRSQLRRQTEQIRRRLESEANLEARYRDLCEHARDMIFSLDAAGKITSFNAAGEAITGFSRTDIVGRDLRELIAPGEEEKLQASFHADAAPFEMRLRRSDGDSATVEVSARPLEKNGTLTGFQAIARDVTQRKQIEENLRQAAKMQAIGQLAGGIAHDFNNLLTVINGYSDLLLAGLNSSSPLFESLREIGKAGERAASLTRQLLAFSRRSIIAPQLLSLNETVREMEQLLRRLLGETVRLTTDLDDDLPKCRLDSGLVGQVLVNLAVNARDAMPRGGELSIRTTYSGGETVRLEVRDNGCGMDRETLQRIFEPYFTTKPLGQGTGLGLATVFGIVEASQGNIEVESEPGLGTTFRIDFPVAGALDDEILPAPPAPESESEAAGLVLLVEDDPNVRFLEQRVLEASGFRVLVAETGMEALDILEQTEEKPDLLVTDVVMPEMNGRELAERVRQTLPSIATLFLSGYTNDEILRMGVLTEEENFLHKPFRPQAFISKIREILQHAMVGSWNGS